MAGFVTGYLQREVYLDIDVVNDCKRGDFVMVTNTTYNADGTVKLRKPRLLLKRLPTLWLSPTRLLVMDTFPLRTEITDMTRRSKVL